MIVSSFYSVRVAITFQILACCQQLVDFACFVVEYLAGGQFVSSEGVMSYDPQIAPRFSKGEFEQDCVRVVQLILYLVQTESCRINLSTAMFTMLSQTRLKLEIFRP